MKHFFVAGLWVEAVVLAALGCGSACSSDASKSSAPPGVAASDAGARSRRTRTQYRLRREARGGCGAAQHSNAGAPAHAGAGDGAGAGAGDAAGREAPKPAGGHGASEDCEGFEVLGLSTARAATCCPTRASHSTARPTTHTRFDASTRCRISRPSSRVTTTASCRHRPSEGSRLAFIRSETPSTGNACGPGTSRSTTIPR